MNAPYPLPARLAPAVFRAGRPLALAALLAAASLVAGCTNTREVRALRDVEFYWLGAPRVTLAGVDVTDVRSADDLRPADLARIGVGAAAGTLPLRMDVLLGACNPPGNRPARLTRFDWRARLNGREAASGTIDDARRLAPGDTLALRVPVETDLVPLVGGGARDLVEAAVALATGQTGRARVDVEVRPYVRTGLGTVGLGTVTVAQQDLAEVPRTAAGAAPRRTSCHETAS
ncbi:MAG: LEA type 2 family protein [Rubricoccaceae bacterium]